MSRFAGKNIVVTGGTSGIGRAAVARLVKEGANVLATGTNVERLQSLKETYHVHTLQNDSGHVDGPTQLANAAREVFNGQVHGVFVNAGFGQFYPLGDIPAEAFDAQFHVNTRGPLLQVQALGEQLVEGASIVMNTSIAQGMGMAGASIYGPTKAALRAIVRVLARELSGRQIRVNAVSPGPIETDFFARTGMPEEAASQMAAQIAASVPLGRFGSSEEAAAVALFLLSDDASFVTGSEYVVDGGMSEV